MKCNSEEEFQKSQALRGGQNMDLFHSNTNSSSFGCLKSACGDILSEGLDIYQKHRPAYLLPETRWYWQNKQEIGTEILCRHLRFSKVGIDTVFIKYMHYLQII